MTATPSSTDLFVHNQRIVRMLADPECVGELLLVGIGMARCVDLGDPPWGEDGHMPLRPIAAAIYGNRRLPGNLLGTMHLNDRGDHRPGRRIRDVFFADRRRYSPDVDGDRHWANVTCGRPMVRRDGLCGRSASTNTRRLTDPLTGQRRWVGACSQPACKQWFTDLVDRNRLERATHPAPVPPANTGGVLERHLPEIDWWKVWGAVDASWTPPPEGRRFERPTLTLIVDDELAAVPVVSARPTLRVLEGGWR